ncbi:MAG: hypothetical protein AAFY71_04460 [Bacteroidota bacterium]
MMNDWRKVLNKTSLLEKRLLEPHVSYYDINSQSRSELAFPLHLMAGTLLFFVAIALVNLIFYGNDSFNLVIFWLYCIFSPFYFPGIYHLYQYAKREENKRLEIDHKHHLITYEDKEAERNLHFSLDSIEKCTIYHTQMLPYGIDYMEIELKGGQRVFCSTLLIDPWEMVDELGIPYQIKKRVFNALPIH